MSDPKGAQGGSVWQEAEGRWGGQWVGRRDIGDLRRSPPPAQTGPCLWVLICSSGKWVCRDRTGLVGDH